jgi:acyl-CoA synthetase (AMP-forming)/AMP-acid ligase II
LDDVRSITTLVDLLQWRAKESPQGIAYIFLKDGQSDEVSITYSELDRQARNIAVALREKVEPGGRVLINHLPGLDYIASFFGCLYASAVAVPVYPPRFNQKLDRLNSIALDAEPGAALTSKAVLENMRPLFKDAGQLGHLRWVESDSCKEAGREAEWTRPEIDTDTLAFMQYTSGSTSDPKGVMLSHLNILSNSRAISEKFELTKEDRGVVWLPPYHDMGLIGGILVPLYNGFPVVLMSPYTFLQRPYYWLQAVSKYKATCTGGPNFAYDLCVKRIGDEKLAQLDLSSVRIAFCGAEPIRASVIHDFADHFKGTGFRKEAFYPCYGLAEATLMVSGPKALTPAAIIAVDGESLETASHAHEVNPTEAVNFRQFVGCGSSPEGHCIRVVNPQSNQECPEGQIGEIWFSGPSVATGYWKRPELSEQVFHAQILGQESVGDFLRTGDLGFTRNGQLFVTGRIKDLLIIRGKNIYPQDIEHTVERSHVGLKRGAGAAFSVLDSDEEKLVIVQELDRTARDTDLTEVIRAIRQSVLEHHGLNPHAVSLIKTNSIPLTSSGKIQRHAARKLFLRGELQERLRDVQTGA